ncbi:MAG: hypothetical protein GY743_21295 [Planctomycetaceae bacterium]|nr:hypothetical protein [Planctomycetaceae bacterium]
MPEIITTGQSAARGKRSISLAIVALGGNAHLAGCCIAERFFFAHGYSGLRPAWARAAHRRRSLFAPDCMIILKVFCYI